MGCPVNRLDALEQGRTLSTLFGSDPVGDLIHDFRVVAEALRDLTEGAHAINLADTMTLVYAWLEDGDTVSTVDRAAGLGAEHGRQAAEAWQRAKPGLLLAVDPAEVRAWRDAKPEPDLSGSVDWMPWGTVESDAAYCAAFRDAVEETVRARVERSTR